MAKLVILREGGLPIYGAAAAKVAAKAAKQIAAELPAPTVGMKCTAEKCGVISHPDMVRYALPSLINLTVEEIFEIEGSAEKFARCSRHRFNTVSQVEAQARINAALNYRKGEAARKRKKMIEDDRKRKAAQTPVTVKNEPKAFGLLVLPGDNKPSREKQGRKQEKLKARNERFRRRAAGEEREY